MQGRGEVGCKLSLHYVTSSIAFGVDVAIPPPCVLLTSSYRTSLLCSTPPQPTWWRETSHLNIIKLHELSTFPHSWHVLRATTTESGDLGLLRGVFGVDLPYMADSYIWKQYKGHGRPHFGVGHHSIEVQKDCELVNEKWSLAIQSLNEKLLGDPRVFMINLQVFRMPWKLELCSSPHGPSSDRRTMLLICVFFYCSTKEEERQFLKKKINYHTA